MSELYAQGDILFERVNHVEPKPGSVVGEVDGVTVLAEGELTGHRHTAIGGAVLFRDDGFAHDIPKDLYIGHLNVAREGAVITHQEHGGIALAEGTYRVRRQRELQPQEASLVLD